MNKYMKLITQRASSGIEWIFFFFSSINYEWNEWLIEKRNKEMWLKREKVAQFVFAAVNLWWNQWLMERREDKQAVAQAAPQRGKLFNKSTIFFRGELSGKEDWLSLLVGWLREVNCGGLWAGGPSPRNHSIPKKLNFFSISAFLVFLHLPRRRKEPALISLFNGWMRERMKLSEMPVKPITNCGAIKR